jgi:hypothetical protein
VELPEGCSGFLQVGSDVRPLDSGLTEFAGLSPNPPTPGELERP